MHPFDSGNQLVKRAEDAAFTISLFARHSGHWQAPNSGKCPWERFHGEAPILALLLVLLAQICAKVNSPTGFHDLKCPTTVDCAC
jgi:hypothetical protein